MEVWWPSVQYVLSPFFLLPTHDQQTSWFSRRKLGVALVVGKGERSGEWSGEGALIMPEAVKTCKNGGTSSDSQPKKLICDRPAHGGTRKCCYTLLTNQRRRRVSNLKMAFWRLFMEE